jgi:hypothetical protein
VKAWSKEFGSMKRSQGSPAKWRRLKAGNVAPPFAHGDAFSWRQCWTPTVAPQGAASHAVLSVVTVAKCRRAVPV